MVQTPSSEEKKIIGPLEAYQIFAEGERESNRLLTERTTIYLTASSILFLAFVMLNQSTTLAPTSVNWFRIILALLGIFLTFILRTFNQATQNALDFLAEAMTQIEAGPEFDYMRDAGILPHTNAWVFIYGKKRWDKNGRDTTPSKPTDGEWWRKTPLFKKASSLWIPLSFGVLWVTSLIIAIINLFNTNGCHYSLLSP